MNKPDARDGFSPHVIRSVVMQEKSADKGGTLEEN